MAEYVLGDKLLEARKTLTKESQNGEALNAFCGAFLECLNFACEGQLFKREGYYIEAELHEGLTLSLTTIAGPQGSGAPDTSIFNIINTERVATNQPTVSGAMIINSVRTLGGIQVQNVQGRICDGSKLKSTDEIFRRATELALYSYGKKLGLAGLNK